MRIIKEMINHHVEDKLYDIYSPIGKLIESLKLKVESENEELFLSAVKEIKYWDFPKISLHAIEEILNFADFLLENYSKTITIKYSKESENQMDILIEENIKNIILSSCNEKIIKEIQEIEDKIKIILNFFKLILPNSLHKDIFASFDNLGLIFKETLDLEIKTKIIDIMMLFNGVKRNTIDSNLDFVDFFTFGIYLRPILTEDIIEKSRKIDLLREKNIEGQQETEIVNNSEFANLNLNSNEKDSKKIEITKNEITKILIQSINEIKKYMIDNKITVDSFDDIETNFNPSNNSKSKSKLQKNTKTKQRHSTCYSTKKHPILEQSFDKIIEEILIIIKHVNKYNLYQGLKHVQKILTKYLNLENNPRLKYIFEREEIKTFCRYKIDPSNELEEKKKNALMQANITLSSQDQKAFMSVYQIEENLYYTIFNFIILISNLNPNEFIFENKTLINNTLNQSTNNENVEYQKGSKNLVSENLRNVVKFNLNIINLIIFAFQRRNKVQMISEYYIEKYLKDVLEVLTSKNFTLEIKSDFLLATITFVSYFDGYESILFQNGLFHSILSDLTSTKFDGNTLEVLSFAESIDQDFFNTILQFLYKTQSFKEIPIHFLNKVLEIPKNGLYPYRIDNVIFSLRKKRTLDENTLNELVIPRLIYEIENFWQAQQNTIYYENVYFRVNEQIRVYEAHSKNLNKEEDIKERILGYCVENLEDISKEKMEVLKINLFNLENNDRAHSLKDHQNLKKTPSLFERMSLINKLFKIIFSIFRHNTNSSSLSYYENKMTESINNFFIKCLSKLVEGDNQSSEDDMHKAKAEAFYYESIMLSCMELIDLICNYLPSAITSLVEGKIFSNLFEYLKRKIPKQTNILNLIFKIFYSIALSEEGNKYLLETGNEILNSIFVAFEKDDYIINNTFSIHNFYTDDFFTPFSLFLRINNGIEINKLFFGNIHKMIKELIIKFDAILEDKDEEIRLQSFLEMNKTEVSNLCLKSKAFKETPFNFFNYKFSYLVNLLSHFLINISQEEKELLTKDNSVDLEAIFMDFFVLAYNPLMLLSLFTNVFSVSILKSLFNKNAEKIINHVSSLFLKNLKILNIYNRNFAEIFFDNCNELKKLNSQKNSNLMEIEDFQLEKNKNLSIEETVENEEVFRTKYKTLNDLILDIQKDKIISKLVHFTEYSLRKMFNLSKNKSLFQKIISLNSIVMLYQLKRQKNFETYMSPVNDCILVINQKYYSKFLSSNLNENIFNLLVENTKKEKIKLSEKTNLKDILIFNKYNALDLQVELNLSNNFRIEFFESNNPFNWEIMDYNSKMLINSHMPVIDFFINLSKAIRKNLRCYTENEIAIYNTWMSIAYSMNLLIDTLEIKSEFERIKEKIISIAKINKNLKNMGNYNNNSENKEQNNIFTKKENNENTGKDISNLTISSNVNEENMKKEMSQNWKYVIEKLIEFINIINNINIILSEKTVSGYLIFQFYKMGGIEKIIDICEFFVDFSELIAINFGNIDDFANNNENPSFENEKSYEDKNHIKKDNNSKYEKKTSFSNFDFYFNENSDNYVKSSKSVKIPIILSLLLKNLWNVVNSIIMKIIKNNYEQMINYGLLLIKEGFNSIFEFNVFIKFYLFSLIMQRFLGFEEKKKNEKIFPRKHTSGLKRISKYSFSFINILYAICDSAINTYKALLSKEKSLIKEEELVNDLLMTGFNKLDIMSAMRDQNHKTIDSIVNFIIYDLDHSTAEYENYFGESKIPEENQQKVVSLFNNNTNEIVNNNNENNINIEEIRQNTTNNSLNNLNQESAQNNKNQLELINEQEMEIEEESKISMYGVGDSNISNKLKKKLDEFHKVMEEKTKKEMFLQEKIRALKMQICNNYLSESEKLSLEKIKNYFQIYLPDKKFTDLNNLEFKNSQLFFTNLYSKLITRGESKGSKNNSNNNSQAINKVENVFDKPTTSNLKDKVHEEINNNFNLDLNKYKSSKKDFSLELKNALTKNEINSGKLCDLYNKYKIDYKQFERPYIEITDPSGKFTNFLKDPNIQETIKKIENENLDKLKQESKIVDDMEDKINQKTEKEEYKHLKNYKSFNFSVVKECFENLFSQLYDSILTDELYQNKIMQIRKMNIIFRLRDILSSKSVESYLLVPFLKELFALECDNYIELQNETNFNMCLNEKLKKFLHDRMLINYVILKDRLKESNIFENLNVDEISDFFKSYDVIECSLDRINNILSIVQNVFLNVHSKEKNININNFEEEHEEVMQNIKQIIYELLFVVHIYLQFINYFNEIKSTENENNEETSSKKDTSEDKAKKEKENSGKNENNKTSEEEKDNFNQKKKGKEDENSFENLKGSDTVTNNKTEHNNSLSSKFYSTSYFELLKRLIETQNKLTSLYGVEKNISILDEANLIIIFSSIVESFNNDHNLTEFIEKGYVKEMLKIRKTHSKTIRDNSFNISFNGSEIKYKIVFDEIFRIFLFHLFEDNVIQQNMLESITYYIFANYLHSKQETSYTENFLNKINIKSKSKISLKEKEKNAESKLIEDFNNDNITNENELKLEKDQIKEESKENNENANTTKNNIFINTTNYKTTDNSDINKNLPIVEMNFDDYLNIIFRLIPKDNEILVRMLKKIAIVEYKNIQNKEKEQPRKIYNTKNMNSRKDSENKDKLFRDNQEPSEKKANEQEEGYEAEEDNSEDVIESEFFEETKPVTKGKKLTQKIFSKKSKENTSSKNQHVLMIRILPEYVPNILSILNDMKINAKDNVLDNINMNFNNSNKDKDHIKDREYILADLNIANNNQMRDNTSINFNSNLGNINHSNYKKNTNLEHSAAKSKMIREIKKNLNENMERIYKDFGVTRNKLINQILKHIWDVCEEGEKEIDRNIDKILYNNTNNNNFIVNSKNHFNSQQKYLFDLDTILIGLGNLIHTYPSVLSVILKFHRAVNPTKINKDIKTLIPIQNANQIINHNIINSTSQFDSNLNNFNSNVNLNTLNDLNNTSRNLPNNFDIQNNAFNKDNKEPAAKNTSSFISFLFRNVFYVMNFYRNCTYSKENGDNIMKDKEDLIRRMGYEPNSHQAILESFRNSNLINFLLNALCLKRRIMNKDEIFLVQTSRKKVMKEIDQILNEINKHLSDENTKKINSNSLQLVNSNNIKQLIYLKIVSFALYTFTDFHDSSHVYSQFNPFEICRAVVSKDYCIIKNITSIMKNLNLTDEYHFSLHKLNTLLLSEIFKYIKLSNKKSHAITSLDESSNMTPRKRGKQNNRTNANLFSVGNRGENGLTDVPINLNLLNNNLEAIIGAIAGNDQEDLDIEEENQNELGEELEEDEEEEEDLEEEEEEEDQDSQEFYYSISSENGDFSGSIQDVDDEFNSDEEQEEIDNFIDNNLNAIDSENHDNDGSEPEEDELSQEEDEEFSQNDPGENESITDFQEDENANENSIVHFHNVNHLSSEEESETDGSDYESDNFQANHLRSRAGFNFLNRFSRSHNTWGGLNIRNNHGQNNLNEIPSILINSGIFINSLNSEDITDELLYANTYDKSHKNQIFYIEDNIVFPFVLYVLQEDLYEFYRPGVYISMINKLRKNQIDIMNNVFLYRYICPFECKFLRNLYFSHNYAKEKFISAYTKEFSKMEIDFLSFGNKESFKMYTSSKDNSDNLKLNVLKQLGIEEIKNVDIEIKQEIEEESTKKEEHLKETDKKEIKYDNYNLEFITIDKDKVSINSKDTENKQIKEPIQNLGNENIQMQIDGLNENIPNKNKDETLSDSESGLKDIQEPVILLNNNNTIMENQDNKINNNINIQDNNADKNKCNLFNEKEISKTKQDEEIDKSKDKTQTDEKKDLAEEIDPEFLQCIPEELREEILQNQRRLSKNKNKSNTNQVYDVNEIDLEILNELPPDIVNDLVNTMGFNIPGIPNVNQASANTNNNLNPINNQENRPQDQGIDWATFLSTLAPDLREDILINLPPEAINQLPQEYIDEYNGLIEQHYSDHHHILNVHTPPPERIDNNFSNPFFNNYFEFKVSKESKKFSLKPLQYNFEEILNSHKYNKDQAACLMAYFDDEFLENLICFNIKHTCKISPKSKILNNQYWILINHLVQNSNIRYKILDLLFILWNLDSIRLKELLKENPNCVNNNLLLKYFYELLIENNLLEEFFYDDYDQFIKLFCTSRIKEMKKFFLDSFYTEKGDYVRCKKSDKSQKTYKRFYSTKDSLAIKEVLSINFEIEENILSNLLRIMLVNSKSDIKKIFALKIFSNIVSSCLKNSEEENDSKNKVKNKNLCNYSELKISITTIEMIIELFYNFETVLLINKDKKSNNPTQLICEVIGDTKCFKSVLNVILRHVEKLNQSVSYEMDHFLTHTKIDINAYSKPLPENILFKIIKLVNKLNQVIYKDKHDSLNNQNLNNNEENLNHQNIINNANVNINSSSIIPPNNNITNINNNINNQAGGNDNTLNNNNLMEIEQNQNEINVTDNIINAENDNNYGMDLVEEEEKSLEGENRHNIIPNNTNNIQNSINANNNKSKNIDRNNQKNPSANKNKIKKIEKLKNELSEFVKKINLILIKCWEKLNHLLFEISKIMKEDQKTLDPKLNRLIPFIEAFITLSHLQFLPEKVLMTINPFIMEKIYKNTPKKTPQMRYGLSHANSPIHIGDGLDYNEFFYRFCDKNKKIINLILRRYPKMFPNEILIKISRFLDLENKKKYFRYELKKLKAEHNLNIQINIRRDHIFMDSYHHFRNKKPEDLRGKLTIRFIGEEAIDAGGVKREWFTLLSKEMFNPHFMLFKLTSNANTYLPNNNSGMFESDHLEIFKFIGRVIAKAIFDGFMLDCYFTRGFYKLICNIPLTYHDLADYDPEYYKSIKWFMENDITDMGDMWNFSYEEDNFGQVEVIDLIPNGRNIVVTEENKFEYVQKLCFAKLFGNIKPQVEAFQKGFYEIIPIKLISIFDPRELELVISGLPTIDLIDLKNNTLYENYNQESQVIKWFWEILESYDNNERAEFLQFVTGSSKVPLEGFSNLQGIGGVNKFKITKVFDKNYDRLPTAHTCTNQLDLPDYPSKEILNERMSLAIREGKIGFGFV